METMLRLINGIAWERVIVALLHSLWQGAIFATLVWALLRGISASRARLRYGIAVAGMLATLVTAMATFEVLGNAPVRQHLLSQSHPDIVAQNHAPVSAAIATDDLKTPTAAHENSAAKPPQPWVWLAMLWIAGMFMMLARDIGSLIGAGKLLRSCRFVEDQQVLAGVEQLRRSMGIMRPVRVATGPSIHVPAVLGTLVPVILLPVAAIGQMPIAHLQIILAHELAHVRRHDYLINLLQLLIEAILFFNPAIWWLSRQIRIEREACCDAIAVAATGSGAEYARSLADIVAGILGAQPALQITPAVKGEGGIVDRVRRVLAPMSKPMVRLPWYSLIGTTALAIALLAGMWGGTHVAVAEAEKILSPAEQVDQIAQAERQLNPQSQSDQASRELRGTVRTEDGKSLPKRITIVAESHSGNNSTTASISCDAKGNFSWNTSGTARIWAQAPGYAPSISDPVVANPDGKFPKVELVLKIGFEQPMQVSDDAGKPIADAPVSVSYGAQIDDSDPLPEMRFKTDADGRFVIPHAAERTALVTMEIHGYQFDINAVKCAPGTEPTIKLMAATPTQGTVTDATTGEPLAGATIYLARREGFLSRTYPPNAANVQMPVLAKTDAQGHFTLDTLRQGCNYLLFVRAKDHSSRLIPQVRPGQAGLECKLGPPHPITVIIHAPAAQMPRILNARNPLVIGNSSWDYGSGLPVKVKDGVGTAVFEDPLPGTVQFYAGDHQVQIDPEKQEGPVELNLGLQTEKKKMRKVIVQLDYPQDGPAPKGRVHIDSMAAGANGYYPLTDAAIKDGRAEFEVPVPTRLMVSQGSVVGYLVPEQSNVEVSDDPEPRVVKEPLTLAGAIGGQVTDESGKPFAKYCFVSLLTVRSASGSANPPPALQPYNCNDGSGKFLLSPAPLGGTYRLVAVAGPRLVQSDEIKIDEEHMLQQVDLKFAAGATVTGTVVDPNGTPLVGQKVLLDCYPVQSNCFGASTVTDRTGSFAFEHVDSQSAEYWLSVAPSENLQGFEIEPLPINDTPLKIQLRSGLSAKGKVIDVQTSKPMANAKVSLLPKDTSQAQYRKAIETITDQDGVFEARGLEEIDYVVNVVGTFPPNSVVLRDNSGKTTGIQVGDAPNPQIKGGQEEVTEIKRMPNPW